MLHDNTPRPSDIGRMMRQSVGQTVGDAAACDAVAGVERHVGSEPRFGHAQGRQARADVAAAAASTLGF